MPYRYSAAMLPVIARKRPNVGLLEHKTLSPKNQNILFF